MPVTFCNLVQPDEFRGAHGVREACGSVKPVAFVELVPLMGFVRSVARRISGLAARQPSKTLRSAAKHNEMQQG